MKNSMSKRIRELANPFVAIAYSITRNFFLSLLVISTLRGAEVLIPLQTCGISPAANRSVTLTPLQALGSNSVPVMDKIQGTTDANGNWSPTLLPGVYQADVRPVWGAVGVTEFYFYVDPSNAVQNAFANLLTGTNNAWPPNQYAYSAQASDARYVMQGGYWGAIPPYTNNVKAFGAYGDGQFTVDISTTNTWLYSPYGHWGPTNIGNRIMICGAQASGQSWITGISNVYSPLLIQISNAVPYNITNSLYCVYGPHDDTTAFQAALNDLTNSGGGYVYVPAGVYLWEGTFQNTNQNNAQVIVPFIGASMGPYYGSSAMIEIFGNHMQRPWTPPNNYLHPPADASVIVPMIIGNDSSSTNFIGSSALDCRSYNEGNFAAYSYGYSGVGNFTTEYRWPDNDAAVYLHDMAFITSFDPHMAVIDLLGGADGSGAANLSVIGGGVSPIYNVQPQGTNSYGIIMPGNFEGTFGPLEYVNVSGFWSGIDCGLIDADKCTVNLCSNAYTIMLSTPAHANIHLANISDCANIITPGHPGYSAPLKADFAIIQGTIIGEGGWWTSRGYIAALYDPSNMMQSSYIPAEIDLQSTNANGLPVIFVGSQRCAMESYDFLDGVESPHKMSLYPISWMATNNIPYQGAGQWDYSFSDIQITNNGSVNGSFDVGGPFASTNDAFIYGNTWIYKAMVNEDFGAENALTFVNSGGGGQGILFRYNNLPNPNLWQLGYYNIPETVAAPGNAIWALTNGAFYVETYQANIDSFGVNTNGNFIALTGTIYPTNGTWNLNAITNQMMNIEFWVGPSNASLISLKYSNGLCFFNTIQQ